MKNCAMWDDIRRQPESLRQAWQHQLGAGSGALAAAARTIAGARRVLFTGMGSSLFAAIPAACYLERYGVAAECVETAELLHFRHASLDSLTVVVIVSRSGESVEAVKLLSLAAHAQAKVVAVTNVADSRLARDAPLSLLFRSANDHMVSVQSYTSSVAVLLLLAANSLDHSVNSWPAIDELCERLERAVQSALASAEEWIGFFADAYGIYFLGRGAALASAHEAALLMQEAARTPAAALSTAQFRHGPVEVTGASTRAVIFPSPGPAGDLDMALAGDMGRMGASVRVCDGRSAGDPFAPVVEIVPVQAASCALAVAQGLDPGHFRYASLVTASESGFGRR